jgi:HK97 family phage major capsid protein
MKHTRIPTLVAACSLAAIGRATAPDIAEFGRKDAAGNGPSSGDALELKTLGDQLRGVIGEVKTFAEKAEKEIKSLGDVSAETKQKADQALTKHTEVCDRIDALEQKLQRRGSDQPERKTLGQRVTDADDVKAFLEAAQGGKRGSVSINVKAIISAATTLADGSAGDFIVPDRQPGAIMPGQRRLVMRDLISVGRTNSNAIQYVKETGFTNNAATVSESTGPTKPQSDIQFDLVTAPITTLAHFVLATRQILSDVPQLQSYIDGRLRYGLEYVEDNQILNGAGTGTDLNGIYTQATAFTQAATLGTGTMTATDIDVLRLAMLQSALANYFPDGFVLNPVDWALIELLKDGQGRYIIGDPKQQGVPSLWGKPVVETAAMTKGKFLAGAFKMGAELFDREDASVAISTEDSDNFRKNLVTILAEERATLAVYRPEAFIKGDFAAAITDLAS